MNQESVTIDQIADSLNLARQTVKNKYVPQLKLKCRYRYIGKRLEFHKDDFDEYVNNLWHKPSQAV